MKINKKHKHIIYLLLTFLSLFSILIITFDKNFKVNNQKKVTSINESKFFSTIEKRNSVGSLNADELYSQGAILANSLNWDENIGYNLIVELVNGLSSLPKTFNEIKNENYNNPRPNFIDLLINYNNGNATDKYIKLETSHWNDVNLSKLSFIKSFNNIKTISFVVKNSNIYLDNLGIEFDISDFNYKLNWLSEMHNLENIEFKFDTPSKNNLNYSFSDFNFIKNIKNIKEVNFSSLYSKNPGFKIRGSIFKSDWYKKIGKGVVIYIPDERRYVGGEDFDIVKSENIYKITKTSSSPLADPTFEDHFPIMFDGEKIEAYLIKGKWYWGFKNIDDIKKIVYGNTNLRQYFSKKVNMNFKIWKLQKYTEDYQYSKADLDSFLSPPPVLKYKLDKPLISNFENVEKVTIDNEIIGYDKIINSSIYLNFKGKFSDIKFYTKINTKIKFFTDVSYMSKKERSIANSVKQNNSEIPEINYEMIKKPENRDSFITFNNLNDRKKVETKFVYGVLYWDFKDESKKDEFKLYSKSANFIAKKISDFMILDVIPKDINEIETLKSTPKILPKIKDGIKIKDINEFRKIKSNPKNIIIDGQNYNMTIRRGNWYYDAPIEKIKFALSSNSVIEYYTSFDKVIDSGKDIKNAIQVETLKFHNIPKKLTIKQPLNSLSLQLLKINGTMYPSSIINGKKVWYIKDENILNAVHPYVDEYGNIYTEIKSSLPLKISEAEWDKDIKTNINKMKISYLSSDSLNKDQILELNKKYIKINDQIIEPIYFNSKIYFKGLNDILGKEKIFAINFKDLNSVSFYTRKYLDNKSSLFIPYLWEVEDLNLKDWEKIKSLLPDIKNPINENSKLVYKDAGGEDKYIYAISAKNKKYWKDFLKAKKLKYKIYKKNGDHYYLENLSYLNNISNFSKVSTIKEVNIEDYDKSVINYKKIIKTESGNIKKIVIISSSIFTGFILFLISIWLLIKWKKAGRK